MACVSKEDCPKCGKHNLQVFEEDGKYTGWCFNPACMTYHRDPYGDQPEDFVPPKAKLKKTLEEIQQEVDEINDWGVHALPSRELKKEYLEYFGIKVGVSEEDGITPTIAAIPIKRGGELVSYRLKLLEE